MPRHIACLTFDFDAMSGIIPWGLTSPTPISRGEFGAIGVGRIVHDAQRGMGHPRLHLPSLCDGRGHRMMMLERLICGLSERGAVFTTMEEAAREYHGRRA